MTTTGFSKPGTTDSSNMEESAIPNNIKTDAELAMPYSASDDSFKPAIDTTHRKLKPRHIQLIGIGG